MTTVVTNTNLENYKSFKFWAINNLQMLLSLSFGSLGQIGIGYFLGKVQSFLPFHEFPQFTVLIPILLGLKGNIDMTLVSRLTTAFGNSNAPYEKNIGKLFVINLIIVQVQSFIFCSVASILAFTYGFIFHGDGDLWSLEKLVISGVLSGSLSSAVMGFITCFVVAWSRFAHVDPDNFALPILASLGDFCILAFYGSFARGLFGLGSVAHREFACLLNVLLLLLTALWTFLAINIKPCKEVLSKDWAPLLLSMLISSGAGLLLEHSVDRNPELTFFLPVISGLGGNFGALNASKLSTWAKKLKNAPEKFSHLAISSCLNLQFLVLPVTIASIFLVVHINNIKFDLLLSSLFFVSAEIQVFILLIAGSFGIYITSFLSLSSDSFVIPLLSACGDTLGSCLLLFFYNYINF